MDSFTADGLRFDVRDGGPSDGTPVVLLHGFPQDGTCWDAVVPRLHAAGLRTLVPDQRGTSPGARPSGAGHYLLHRCVDDVAALLDAAGIDRAHVVGHDWGGAAAWGVAGWHPDRTASLTVVSTPHPAAMAEALRGREQLQRSWYMGAFLVPRAPEALLRRRAVKLLIHGGLPPERAEHYAARLREPGAATGMLNWYRATPRSLRDAVPDSTVPTTYLWGRDDAFLGPRAAAATSGHVSGDYRFVDVAGGHWLPETSPEVVANAVLGRAATG